MPERPQKIRLPHFITDFDGQCSLFSFFSQFFFKKYKISSIVELLLFCVALFNFCQTYYLIRSKFRIFPQIDCRFSGRENAGVEAGNDDLNEKRFTNQCTDQNFRVASRLAWRIFCRPKFNFGKLRWNIVVTHKMFSSVDHRKIFVQLITTTFPQFFCKMSPRVCSKRTDQNSENQENQKEPATLRKKSHPKFTAEEKHLDEVGREVGTIIV